MAIVVGWVQKMTMELLRGFEPTNAKLGPERKQTNKGRCPFTYIDPTSKGKTKKSFVTTGPDREKHQTKGDIHKH